MRIGASGASGKIGSHICSYLDQFLPGSEIIGESRTESGAVRNLKKKVSNFYWQSLDLLDRSQCADFLTGFRVIIVIEVSSYVNIMSSRLQEKFKTQKINSWCAA